MRDNQKAKEGQEKVLEINKKSFGAEHFSYANYFGESFTMKRFQKFQRKITGDQHIEYAIQIGNLFGIYHDMGIILDSQGGL